MELPLEFIAEIAKGEGIGLHNYEQIKYIAHMIDPPSMKPHLEIFNLIQGWKYMDNIITELKSESEDSYLKDYAGLIETEEMILELHKIVMKDLLPRPGRFSTCQRFAHFAEEVYQYPRFISTQVVMEGFLYFVDKLNYDMSKIKCESDAQLQRQLLLTHVSKFCFAFLSLHVFPDGNGRLCKLLVAYMIHTFTEDWVTFPASDLFLPTLVGIRKTLTLPDIVCSKEEIYALINKLLSCDITPLKALLLNCVK